MQGPPLPGRGVSPHFSLYQKTFRWKALGKREKDSFHNCISLETILTILFFYQDMIKPDMFLRCDTTS
ncbi:hypothetical protein KSD_91310 [Ktedonobacter sp. SOSP1-85]|nr:hypothetical protein KSD_91310 [Ktedonobacter sp. SOSP1-85]